MILAEQVAISRKCDEFGFWVFSPIENDKYLWKEGLVEKQFRETLTLKGNNNFQKIHLETIFDKLQAIVSEHDDQAWLESMEEKYKIS